MPERATVKNADDREQVAEGRARIEYAEHRFLDDLRFVLMDVRGRRVFWQFLAFCGVFETPFGYDDRTTSRNIGRGDAGRWLIAQIGQARPTAIAEMMQEAHKETER